MNMSLTEANRDERILHLPSSNRMIFMTIEMMEKLVFTEAGITAQKATKLLGSSTKSSFNISEKDFEVILTA